MVETERLTFAVTTTGVGRPDYSPAVAASKLILDSLQTRFLLSFGPTIAASSTTSVTVYTVPTGYKLTLGAVVITCEASLIQRLEISSLTAGVTTWLLDEFRYDMEGKVIWGPESAVEVDAGGVVTALLFNYDSVQRQFNLNVQGFIERVN